jgi:serine/threonine protein kinase
MCVDVYIAPEVYKNEPFDRSVDVFAFGLILYEVRKTIQSTFLHARNIGRCVT